MNASRIAFDGVWKRYGESVAVRDLSMTIEPGSLTTLLGPSGCGKTTTLRMIAGLETASQGRIRIGSRDVTDESAADRNVSMVFQNYALFPHMSVLDNVAYGLIVARQRKTVAHEKAMQALSLVKLGELAARFPSELSGGQQQRVAIARALVLEPEVLLFDEPLSNLDTRLRRAMRDEIRDLQRRLGLTVVYVTHDQSEALAISDRVIVMKQGRIIQAGDPQELYHRPRDAFVASFMGECNILDAELLDTDGQLARLSLGGLQFQVPHRGAVPGKVQVSLRPEGVRVSEHLNGGLVATVKNVSYLGGTSEITIDTGMGDWFAVQTGSATRLTPGQTVDVGIEPHCVALLSDQEP
ncbi:MAG: ABC transporter ATP-binding protein [Ramlibacter sp.]|nr:ABC transporter ATP-binding protein [Ramlibacter sp.]